MPSETEELTWVTLSSFFPSTQYGSSPYGLAKRLNGGLVIAIMQGQITGLPSGISVTNARIEVDLYNPISSGSGQLRRLMRHGSKWLSTWDHEDYLEPKPWITGGPFSVSSDLGTMFWSGAWTNDDPQILSGGSALAAYIEERILNASGYVALALYVPSIGMKYINGARLRFDYTVVGTPAVTGFSPEDMDFGETPILYVYGSDLDTGSLDKIQLVGGATYDLTSIALDSSSQVHGTVPAGVAVDEYTVRVRIGGSNYDAPGSFVVSSTTPTITDIYTGDGGSGIVHHKRRTVTIIGTNLSGTSSIDLLGQEGQGNTALMYIIVVSGTEITGELIGPIPPGKHKAKVVCTTGTVYSAPFDVSLGPAWW